MTMTCRLAILLLFSVLVVCLPYFNLCMDVTTPAANPDSEKAVPTRKIVFARPIPRDQHGVPRNPNDPFTRLREANAKAKKPAEPGIDNMKRLRTLMKEDKGFVDSEGAKLFRKKLEEEGVNLTAYITNTINMLRNENARNFFKKSKPAANPRWDYEEDDFFVREGRPTVIAKVVYPDRNMQRSIQTSEYADFDNPRPFDTSFEHDGPTPTVKTTSTKRSKKMLPWKLRRVAGEL